MVSSSQNLGSTCIQLFASCLQLQSSSKKAFRIYPGIYIDRYIPLSVFNLIRSSNHGKLYFISTPYKSTAHILLDNTPTWAFFRYTKRHIPDADHSRIYFYPGLGYLYTAISSRGNYKKEKRKNLKPEDSENVSISINIRKICKIVLYCRRYTPRPHRDLF